MDGVDVTAEPMYARARLGLGYLAQEPTVFKGLTVEENLRLGAITRERGSDLGEDLERIYHHMTAQGGVAS